MITAYELGQVGITQWSVISRFAGDWDNVWTFEGSFSECIASALAQVERSANLAHAFIAPYNFQEKAWDLDSPELAIVRGRATWDTWFNGVREMYPNARLIGADFAPDAPDVLPFDDTPMLTLTAMQLPDALRYAITDTLSAAIKSAFDNECQCDECDEESDYWAVRDELEELEGIDDTWRALFCELLDAPAALIDNALDARNWYDLRGFAK